MWQYCVPRGVSLSSWARGWQCSCGMRNTRRARPAARPSPSTRRTRLPASGSSASSTPSSPARRGPYILSDLRYGAGPLYVRYGGFTERFCLDSRGEMAPAIENPAGDLVPDLRSPVFTMPEWVTLAGIPGTPSGRAQFGSGDRPGIRPDRCPAFLERRRSLHRNRQADRRAGDPERGQAARGLGRRRVRRGHQAAPGTRCPAAPVRPGNRPGSTRVFPGRRASTSSPRNSFPGRTLNSFFVERYPLGGPVPDPAATKAYAAWALRICGEVERAAAAMHERGVVFNDLHMFNIIVRPDDTVAFIDFEAASDVSEGRTRTVGNPGFAAPRDRTGFDVDAYSLACLRLAMFMPLTTLFALDRDKAAQLAVVIAGLFPVPGKFLDEAVREIIRDPARRLPDVTGPDAAPRDAGDAGTSDAVRAPVGTGWRRTWWPRSGRARPRTARTGSSRRYRPVPRSRAAVSASRTARPACCTRCRRRSACACRNTRNGWLRAPRNRLRAPIWASTTGWPGCVHAGAARPAGRRGPDGAHLP